MLDHREVATQIKTGGYIYIFRSESVIKIGYAWNLERRMKKHQESYRNIEILGIIQAGYYANLERQIHYNLRDYRINKSIRGVRECYRIEDLPQICRHIVAMIKKDLREDNYYKVTHYDQFLEDPENLLPMK
jgi:hypothetical protein